MTLLRPQALKPGDHVAVVCLSSPIDKPAKLESGMQAMAQVGLKAEAFPSALAGGTMYDYLAGDDEQRVADLTRALTDPKYAAVFLAKGGYGVQRALQKMDWSLVDPTGPRSWSATPTPPRFSRHSRSSSAGCRCSAPWSRARGSGRAWTSTISRN